MEIGDQAQALVGRDREVDRRAEQRVGQRQRGDRLGAGRIGAGIENAQGVVAGREEPDPAVVPGDLLVVSD